MTDYTPREAKLIDELKTQLTKQDYLLCSAFKAKEKDMLEWKDEWTEAMQEKWEIAKGYRQSLAVRKRSAEIKAEIAEYNYFRAHKAKRSYPHVCKNKRITPDVFREGIC